NSKNLIVIIKRKFRLLTANFSFGFHLLLNSFNLFDASSFVFDEYIQSISLPILDLSLSKKLNQTLQTK
ncbi:MAG: hypothetical protein ACK4G1_03850, partial [Ignavibacteria bacterium]